MESWQNRLEDWKDPDFRTVSHEEGRRAVGGLEHGSPRGPGFRFAGGGHPRALLCHILAP